MNEVDKQKIFKKYSKTCPERPLSKRPKLEFQDHLLLNAGQKYCRMLHGEHSAILSTCIKLPFVVKIFVSSIFEWPLKTGFTVITSVKTFYKNTHAWIKRGDRGVRTLPEKSQQYSAFYQYWSKTPRKPQSYQKVSMIRK